MYDYLRDFFVGEVKGSRLEHWCYKSLNPFIGFETTRHLNLIKDVRIFILSTFAYNVYTSYRSISFHHIVIELQLRHPTQI